jgi:hypothetical protein
MVYEIDYYISYFFVCMIFSILIYSERATTSIQSELRCKYASITSKLFR